LLVGGHGPFWLGAKADYAIRALAALADAGRPLTADAIAKAQQIPKTFLTVILSELVRADVVRSRRGRVGGYTLTRPPAQIAVVDVLRAVGGPVDDPVADPSDPYQRLRGTLVDVLESTTLAGLFR
jgi:Rrf2 family protein